jgi:dipicolinate synthase subunit B
MKGGRGYDFMMWKEKKIGIAFTGSFCTYQKAFEQLGMLVDTGAQVYPIFSDKAQSTDSRFGRGEEFLKKAEEITGRKVICTISQAEPIGPKSLLDVLVILPCTGNTMAKLANGITDSPVLMAAKAHLRNEKPLVLSVATNDALSMNMKNMGLLMNAKHIYFVPFGQDQPKEKPNSLIAHTRLLVPTIEAAMEGRQYQPVIQTFE